MLSILRKEFYGFLDALIAYVVIGVFLTAIGLFMWVLPDTNLLDYGFAQLDPLFFLGPYVFLFLIPAITMRAFAEERRAGTLELLLTKPITDGQLIGGKYLACVLLVLFSLLPTLVYVYSVYALGSPVGNLDLAGTAGSYLGLFLLGAVFVAAGLLSSALSSNQIVAFVLAVATCFLLYEGFGLLASLDVWGREARLVSKLGMAYHYQALSRGLIDSRNVIYFLSVIALLLLTTRTVIESRKW